MTPEYFDFLGDQLVAASQREHRRHTARPRRWQKMTRRPLFIALAALVIAGSAIAAIQPWAPSELTANSNSDPPTLSAAPVPSAQSSSYEVLRRPQNAVDRGPATRAALKYVHAGGSTGVKSNDIRLLNPGAENQPPVVLVPVDSGRTVGGRAPDLLCLVVVNSDGGAGKTCPDTSGPDKVQLSNADRFGYGLVPDGVTSVRVTPLDGAPFDVPVHDNFFSFTGDTETLRGFRVEGRRADGTSVP